MEFASKNLTVGQLNALVKTLGGEGVVRGILDGTKKFVLESAGGYELYRHERQSGNGYIVGHGLESHLRDSGLLGRALSLESERVKGWLANPSTYPEELKGIYPCLWGSARDRDGYRRVPYLDWHGGRVVVDWHWVGRGFDRLDPALLASTEN